MSVVEIAVEAHRDQADKAGEPFYLHPMRVGYFRFGSKVDLMGISQGIFTRPQLEGHGLRQHTVNARVCFKERLTPCRMDNAENGSSKNG